MPKLTPDCLVGVSETLLIPLHYRVEHSRSQASSFRDVVGERFQEGIDYDWSKFDANLRKLPVFAARTDILDRQVKAFIDEHPQGLIVNLGCGLDTRFHRLDNGTISWIEIDLPDVIAFRKKLSEPQSARHRMLAASVLTESWVDEIAPYRRASILLVAEGLFPYFTEAQHRLVFAYVARRFPGQQMLFQNSPLSLIQGLSKSSELSGLNDLSKLRTAAEMQWGLEDGAEVAQLDPRVHFVEEFSMLAGLERQLPELAQRLSAEQISKAGTIVHVRFD